MYTEPVPLPPVVRPSRAHQSWMAALLSVGSAVLLAAACASPASAQSTEGASGLSAPRGDRTAPAPTATAEGATSTEAADLGVDVALTGDIPPPPGTGYPEVRYAAPPGHTGIDEDLARIPPRLRARLRVLDQDLQALSARGNSRILDGVFSLLAGGLGVGIGIYKWDERETATYLLLYGTANLVTGLVSLFVTPNPSSRAIEYTHMPMTDLEAVQARVDFGEASLEYLSRRTKIARFIESGINVALGLMVIPLYLAPNDFSIDSPFDYLILIGSGISLITGIIGLASRSDAEKRWTRYQELRDRLDAEGGGSASARLESARSFDEALQADHESASRGFRLRAPGVAPLERGAALTLQATF